VEQITYVVLKSADGFELNSTLTFCIGTLKKFFTQGEFFALTSIQLYFVSLFHTGAKEV
jgi:hypothetical protein